MVVVGPHMGGTQSAGRQRGCKDQHHHSHDAAWHEPQSLKKNEDGI